MRKLKRVVPCALALMMSVQGVVPTVPVTAATQTQVSSKVAKKNVLSKKAYAEALQQIKEDGAKTSSKTSTFRTEKSTNLKTASVKADSNAKEGEVGYQFTQDQYVDETHRIRYKYLIIADGEVSAQYIDGIYYKNGEVQEDTDGSDKTYDVTDELTYPTAVTLNGTTYKVTEAKTSYVRAKSLIIPEGYKACQVVSSSAYVETMTLPSTLEKINGGSLYEVSSNDDVNRELELKKKQVFKEYKLTNPEKAKYVSVKDGIIYNKDQTELLAKVPACLEKDTVTLPDTLKEVPSGAFQSNLTIKNVVFGKNITTVQNGAFAYSDIQDVQMTNSVTSVDAYAFYYCKKLENVKLSNQVAAISGENTFAYTDSLKTVNLGNVKTIDGEHAFAYSGLESVDLSNAEDLKGRQQFLHCEDLKTVYIGKNTDFTGQKAYGEYISIGVNPFLGCSNIEKYVEKEKNKNHLYVEDGKLYASQIEGGLYNASKGDYVSKTYKGKILIGYPTTMQKKDVKNGTLTLPKDITAVGSAAGLSTFNEARKDGSNKIERYYNKLVVPSNIEAIDTLITLPQDDIEIDYYGNKIIQMGMIFSQGNTEFNNNKSYGTKTLKFKSEALRKDFEANWKDSVMSSYDGETVVSGVLPQKNTSSISFTEASKTLKCTGRSQEIHLFTNLSSDDCTDVVKFSSSNESLATVDENGVVTTKREHHGTTTITATAGKYTAKCDVSIVGNSGLYSSSVENEQNLGTIEITDVNNPNFYEIANQLRHVKCADCRGNEFLTEGIDYEIVYSNYKKSGTATATIKGKGAFEGFEKSYPFTVNVRKHGAQGYTLQNLNNKEWTGKEVTQGDDLEVHCKDCGTLLKEGTDYKLEYSNNINPGDATLKVVGLGDYEGYDEEFTFRISEAHGWNGFYAENYKDGANIGTYPWSQDGVYVDPGTIRCKHCDMGLTQGTDYKLEYSDTSKPGTATVKVIGLNSFDGFTMTFTYTIKGRGLSSDEASDGASLGTYRWTGKEVRPDVGKITDAQSGVTLKEGTDYKVTYSNNIDAGNGTAEVIGLGDYAGAKLTFTFTIEKQCGWNGFYVKDHKDGSDLGTFEWNGGNVEPELEVRCNHCDKLLEYEKDYTLTYSDTEHRDPGKVTVTVTGINDFEGFKQSFTYTIGKRSFYVQGHENNDLLGEMDYTGNELLYPIGLVFNSNGEALTEGTDYKVEYSDNIKPGTAKVKVVGLNDYEGCELSFTFKIVDACGQSGFSSNLYVDGETMETSYDYTGKAITPDTGIITCNHCGQALIKGTDYKVEYSNNIEPGVATMKIIGLDRYKDHSLTVHYTINSKKFYLKDHKDGDSLGTVKWTGKEVKYDIGKIYAKHNDQKLKEGTDYKLVYSDNVDAGTAKVEVVGMGDYAECKLTFRYTIEKQCGWNGFYFKGHKDGDDLGVFKWTGNDVTVYADMRCSHCDKELEEGTDFEVEYSNNYDPGKATMKVTGKGDFVGYEATYTYTIEKDQATTGDQKPTTTTTETKPSTSQPTTSTTKPTTTTTETKPTTSTSKPTTTTTETKPTTSTSQPTTTTTETKPTTSTSRPTTTTTETKPTTTTARPTTTEPKPTNPEKKKITSVTGITNATYTGKAITRKITVKSGSVTLKEGKDYKVSYSNNKNCGVATVKITGIGNYQGSVTKTFKIVPKKAAIRSFVAAKKAAVLNFFKNDGGITGYQINYAYDSKFKAAKSKNLSKVKYKTVTIKKKKYSYSSYKITGLKSKKYVYVRIRAYKQVGKTKIYGSWSAGKKVKIK